MAGRLVLDASVAAKLFFEEEGSDRAAVFAASGWTLSAPDFIHVEFASIASTKVRRNEIAEATAADASRMLATVIDQVFATPPLTQRAFELAVTYGCSAYDGIYLALAETLGCPVLTADQRLVRSAVAGGLSHLVRPL